MCRRLYRTKKSGQVILETAIVFVSLVTLAVSSMALFSNLNLNMTERIDKYRQDRFNAVNGIPVNPENYLYYYPHEIILGSDTGSGGNFNSSFYEDERIEQAELCLERQDRIMYVINPYKMNQSLVLARQLELENYYENGQWYYRWLPLGYLEAVQNLVDDSIALSNQALDEYDQAISYFQQALDDPLVPGPFDLEHPENRELLQSQIDSLREARPGLRRLLDREILPRLRYVRRYIGEVGGAWGGQYYPTWRHYQSIRYLQELVEFCGTISPAILANDLANDINETYTLLQGAVSFESANAALAISAEILQHPQVQESSLLRSVAQSLYNELDYCIAHWDDVIQ